MADRRLMVLNLGSTSFKCKLYRMGATETLLASGGVESIGGEGRCRVQAGEQVAPAGTDDLAYALAQALHKAGHLLRAASARAHDAHRAGPYHAARRQCHATHQPHARVRPHHQPAKAFAQLFHGALLGQRHVVAEHKHIHAQQQRLFDLLGGVFAGQGYLRQIIRARLQLAKVMVCALCAAAPVFQRRQRSLAGSLERILVRRVHGDHQVVPPGVLRHVITEAAQQLHIGGRAHAALRAGHARAGGQFLRHAHQGNGIHIAVWNHKHCFHWAWQPPVDGRPSGSRRTATALSSPCESVTR